MPKNDTTLKPTFLSVSDTGAIHQIERQSFHDPWSNTRIAAHIDRPYSVRALGVFINDTLAAYSLDTETNDVVTINRLAVAPDYRFQKIGSQLVATLQRLAVATNRITAINARLQDTNVAAQCFLRANGFQALPTLKTQITFTWEPPL